MLSCSATYLQEATTLLKELRERAVVPMTLQSCDTHRYRYERAQMHVGTTKDQEFSKRLSPATCFHCLLALGFRGALVCEAAVQVHDQCVC